jgi:hypothetical protein
MKNIIFLALILVLKATSVHAQTSISEVPSFVGNVDDAGDSKAINNTNGPVFKNRSAVKFNVATESIKGDAVPVAKSAINGKLTQTKEVSDYKQKSFANLNPASQAKRNDITFSLDSYHQ